MRDSNPRHPAYHADGLPAELPRQLSWAGRICKCKGTPPLINRVTLTQYSLTSSSLCWSPVDLSTGYSVHPLWEGREGGREREGGRKEGGERGKEGGREGVWHWQRSSVQQCREEEEGRSSILCNLVQIPLVW